MKTKFDSIIKNGTLALLKKGLESKSSYELSSHMNDNYDFVVTDLGINAGKISAIGSLSETDAQEIIDATHLFVFPGIIDSQVHFREPGLTHKEDLSTGTKAALMGGVTSIFEMPNTSPSTTTAELFEQKLQLAKNRCSTNYAFFIGASPENAESLAELEKHPHCSGIKIFMGSSTGNLLVESDPVLEKIFRHGHRRVILHAEDEFMLRERKHLAEESKSVKDHPYWRSAETALSATRRAIGLSEKTHRPIHILHVSSKDEAELIQQKKQNLKSQLSCEILPQYLTLWGPECYERLGTLAQQNPPIRDRSHYEGLWKAMQRGVFDVLGSDHAPHTLEEKRKPYPSSPSGMPGVQTLLPLMLHHVNEGRLSLSQLLTMLCENPIHVFGIKNKGRLQVGYDADLTLVDLRKERQIQNKDMYTKVGWTAFDGMKIKGWPVMTFLAGELCMREAQLLKENRGQAVSFDVSTK